MKLNPAPLRIQIIIFTGIDPPCHAIIFRRKVSGGVECNNFVQPYESIIIKKEKRRSWKNKKKTYKRK